MGRTYVNLIGGSHDGETWEIRPDYKGDVLDMPIYAPLTLSKTESSGLSVERYRLRLIKGEAFSFAVWVHESLSLDDAISRLMDAHAAPGDD